MIPAPRWKVVEKDDCREILRKGIAKGVTEVRVEAIVPESEE